MYETKISNAKWIAYDIPGNIGWIAYIVTLVIALAQRADMIHILAVIPALFMLIGIAELISERIAKLDRVLPKSRLYRGFGALTLGGALGTVVSVISVVAAVTGGVGVLRSWIMLAGAVLCFVFGGLLLIGYKQKV